MWNKKIRKIVDICAASAFGLAVLGVGGYRVLSDLFEYKSYSDDYDAQKQAALDALRDDTGHIPTKVKSVKPTETSVGYTSGTKCVECGEYYQGHKEIPMLTDEHYNRVVTAQTDSSVTIRWDLKEEYTADLGTLKYSFTYTKGFITIGTTNYLSYEFNKTFPGVEMSYDEKTNTITLDVKKEGGVVIDKIKSVKIAAAGTTLRTTGQPLTFVVDGNTNGFDLESNSVDLIVENDLEVHVKDRNNVSSSLSGVLAHKITVKDTGCLRCSNFYYGIFTREDIDVEGCFDVSGTNKAIYTATNTNGGKNVNVGANRDLYIKEVKKTLTDSKIALTDCGKHLVVCPAGEDVKNHITYKLEEITTTPTESSAGSATFKCVADCGTTKTVTLPKLSEDDYEVVKNPTDVDGQISYFNCYTYHFSDMHADGLVFDLRENLKSYFTVGGTYCTVVGWNAKTENANAQATVDQNEMTITLTGDATFDFGELPGIDFSIFDKVNIVGSGTYKIITNQTSALTAKALEIGANVTLDFDGTNAVKSAYGEHDRDNDFVALHVTDSLIVNGKINVKNFYVGMLVNGTCDVKTNANITMTNTLYGIYSNAELVFTTEGTIKYTNTSKVKGTNTSNSSASVGIMTYRAKNTFNFKGSSITEIDADNKAISTFDTGAGTDVTIHVSDSASLTAHARNTNTNNYAVSNINHFIVGNGEDGSTQCSATVNFIANSASALTFLSGTSLNHTLIINSSNIVTCLKDGSKASQTGVAMNGGKYTVKILSSFVIQHFGTAMVFTNATMVSGECEGKITTPQNDKTQYSGTVKGTDGKNYDVSGWFVEQN